MIRTDEVTAPREALERILDIISRYSTLTAADKEIVRAANRGLFGKDPYGRWKIELLVEEEQTDPLLAKQYFDGNDESIWHMLDGRWYLDGSCYCHAPGKHCNYGRPVPRKA